MEVISDSIALPRLLAPGAPACYRAETRPEARPQAALRRSLGITTLAWVFGSVWYFTTTGEPLTVFAQKLGASNFQFGLLTALPFIASLAAVPGCLLGEWSGGHKRVFLVVQYLQRLMWLAIPMLPLWMLSRFGPAASGQALAVFLWLAFVMYALGAAGTPNWVTWMADVVPPRINGKYFSRRRQWGMLLAVPAAIFGGWVLDRCAPAGSWALLRWCALLFLGAAVCGLADIHLFHYVPAVPRPRRTLAALVQCLKRPLCDRQFVCFSCFVGTLTFAVNFLGQFATLYLLDQVGMSNLGAQLALVVAPMLAQLLVLGLWGRAADRMGKRPLLILSSIALVPVGMAWCLVTPQRVWLAYALSALGAGLWTGVEVANLNLVLEKSGTCGRQRGSSSFVAANSVIINLAGCLGGLAAGLIAQLLRDWHWQPWQTCKVFTFYDVLFTASGLLRLGSLIAFLPFMREPAARPTRHALRFMTAALAGLLITAPLEPIRILLGRHTRGNARRLLAD